MIDDNDRVALIELGGLRYALVPREEILREIEHRMGRTSAELITLLEADAISVADLSVMIHIAIRAVHGEVMTERQIGQEIAENGVAGYRERLKAMLITARFCRDLAKMEQAQMALWRLRRVHAKLRGARGQQGT
ncbi:MAG: hypothetical protein ACE5EM_10165 [Sphingomonadales bacterium]